MCKKSKCNVYLIASVISFFVFSVSFLLMPIETRKVINDVNLVSIVAGVMFWLGLVIGSVMQILFCKSIGKVAFEKKTNPGLISFFKNKLAMVFDVLLILSGLGLVFSIILTSATGYACYIFVTLTAFCFCAHCIFNGKNYCFIANIDNIKTENRNVKADNSVLERKRKNGKH